MENTLIENAVGSKTDEVGNKSENAKIIDEAGKSDNSVKKSDSASSKENKQGYFKDLVEGISTMLILCIFILTFCLTLYYVVVGQKVDFTADYTDTLSWAVASVDGGSIYNSDFKYACFLPFGTSLLMLPFARIFGFSMTAHIFGMTLFFICFMAAILFFFRSLKWNWRGIAIGISFILAMTLSSTKIEEMFWGHTIYYSLGFLFLLVGSALYFGMNNIYRANYKGNGFGDLEQKARVKFYIVGAVLALFTFFTGFDGISAVSIYAIPFTGAILLERLFDNSVKPGAKRNLFAIGIAVVLIISVVLGVLFNDLLAAASGVSEKYADSYSTYSSQNMWLNHFLKMPNAWLTLWGMEDLKGYSIASIASIGSLLHFAIAILFLVTPIIATCFYKKYDSNKDYTIRIWIWIHWIVTAIIFIGYIFGQLSKASWRMIPVGCTAMTVSIMFIHWTLTKRKPIIRAALLIAIVYGVAGFVNVCSVIKIAPNDYKKENDSYQLMEFLKNNNLNYGYADFWNANSVTVFSNDTIKVRSVKFSTGTYGLSIRPYYYQTEISWYKDQPNQSEYFLILDEDDYEDAIENPTGLVSTAERELETTTADKTEYHILVFDHNIIR